MVVIDDLHELRSADALAWLERFLAPAAADGARGGERRARIRDSDFTGCGWPAAERDACSGSAVLARGDATSCSRRRGSRLSDAGVALLYERTEGWAAGLRLAAISLARHPDPERFVTEFSGSERTVAGYLLAEVLERQPAEVRELLLRTSILERVSGPLADHLTGGSGSERILQELEDANAFVTSTGRRAVVVSLPPPVRRPAAAGAAARSSPAMAGSLHRAAAQWHEQHGGRRRGDPPRAGGARLTAGLRVCWPTTTSS